MKIQQIPPYNPSSGWGIRSQTTRNGIAMQTMTEYLLDNGKRLVTIHSYRNGKKIAITKSLYTNGWSFIKDKVIQFIDGKRKVTQLKGY
jgi:hypothetical protein